MVCIRDKRVSRMLFYSFFFSLARYSLREMRYSRTFILLFFGRKFVFCRGCFVGGFSRLEYDRVGGGWVLGLSQLDSQI